MPACERGCRLPVEPIETTIGTATVLTATLPNGPSTRPAWGSSERTDIHPRPVPPRGRPPRRADARAPRNGIRRVPPGKVAARLRTKGDGSVCEDRGSGSIGGDVDRTSSRIGGKLASADDGRRCIPTIGNRSSSRAERRSGSQENRAADASLHARTHAHIQKSFHDEPVCKRSGCARATGKIDSRHCNVGAAQDTTYSEVHGGESTQSPVSMAVPACTVSPGGLWVHPRR